ncbi:MAG: cyclic nucleotide-binding domain-containing protein, partial [Clostridia bacterium]|nr:cyclic nucleotide-binding domain-containing protein [Clostridia bacterium]
MDESKLAEKGFEKLFQKKAKPEYYALFARALREETVEDAGVIYEEGDASDGLCLIINGKIRLRNPENDSESVREAGDVFGTAGILRARAKREETALAAGEATVAFLSREEYERLTAETPDLGRWLERSLLLHENERRKTAEDDREKRRKSARAIFLALLPLAWAVIWDGLIEKYAGEGTLPPAAMMALFLGIALLLVLFFFAGRFSKRELGLDCPPRLRTYLFLLAAAAELSALFFLAAMLEDNGVLSGFAAPGGGIVTGGGSLLFLGMS